ncbi:MAG: hypothetical protein OEM93_14025 [Rhodospirillales bacterium]|nr:hypothetical protein [Rhodospirillales bacterium]MDH3790860.1 hypothetical protein [Rhodospirillales bacterium]
MKRLPIAVCLLLALGPTSGPGRAEAKVWAAGGLTFSDERGGFRLISVSGRGSIEDPIVIVEELTGVDPVVLVVRGARDRAPGAGTDSRVMTGPPILYLAVIKIVLNRSRRVWGGFDLELQQELGKPSPYGDGLSFDQTGGFGAGLHSDRFAINRQLFEPYDRVRFQSGSVDPGAQVRFRFFITDPTPVQEFYLLQEPRLLMAGGPRGTVSVAER